MRSQRSPGCYKPHMVAGFASKPPITPALLRLDPTWDPLRADPASKNSARKRSREPARFFAELIPARPRPDLRANYFAYICPAREFRIRIRIVGPPVLPPDDFRRVHFCPEKSGLSAVRIGACVISKRSTAREKYPGGAGVIKLKGSFGLFCLPAPELNSNGLEPKNGPNSR